MHLSFALLLTVRWFQSAVIAVEPGNAIEQLLPGDGGPEFSPYVAWLAKVKKIRDVYTPSDKMVEILFF